MQVFKNLGETKAKELYDNFVKSGMDKDAAFNEVYSIECSMDEDE